MTELSFPNPEVNKPDRTEDPKIVTAFNEIKSWAAGHIDSTNLAPGTLERNSAKSIISTEQTRTNTAYGTLATPDEISLTLAENGLIAVAFQATWKCSVEHAARAAIFVGANQLKVAHATIPEIQAAAHGGTPLGWQPLSSCAQGLVGLVTTGLGEYAGDVTTGQVVGVYHTTTAMEIGSGIQEDEHQHLGGVCYIFAAAATYAITIQYKATSGSVTVKNRKLWGFAIS